MDEITFEAWPKIARMNREMIVTEKLDGTNAAIIITEDGRLATQSRNRLITPDDDNYGFAGWASRNRDALIEALGPGRHFGEWWGAGIQRRYGLQEKRFSLFNTSRWEGEFDGLPQLGVVPVLARAPFSTEAVNEIVRQLGVNGSVAAPGFARPEGVCVFLPASREFYKVTVENDESPKSVVA